MLQSAVPSSHIQVKIKKILDMEEYILTWLQVKRVRWLAIKVKTVRWLVIKPTRLRKQKPELNRPSSIFSQIFLSLGGVQLRF